MTREAMPAPGEGSENSPPLPHPIALLARAALWRIPLCGAAGLGVLALAAWLSQSHAAGQSMWAMVAGGGLTMLMAAVGFAGGMLFGVVGSLSHVVRVVEQAVRGRLRPITELPTGAGGFRMPVKELHDRIDEVVTRVVTVTVGRLPLPAWLDRHVRTHLREALLTDFIADLKEHNTGTVRFVDVRAWLLDKGLTLAISPIYVQLGWWQWLIAGGLGLLTVVVVLAGRLLH